MLGKKTMRDSDKKDKRTAEIAVRGTGRDPREHPYPKVFHNLKKIRIGNNKVFIMGNLCQHEARILDRCLALEEICLPFGERNDFLPDISYSLWCAFDVILDSLEDENTPVGRLKIVDFANYYAVERKNHVPLLQMGSPKFLELCDVALKHNVKFLNVGADWFDNWGNSNIEGRPPRAPPHLGAVVYSMVNLHPYALRMEMRNLEKIEIRSSRYSNPGSHAACVHTRPDWPALKVLDVTVNSDVCGFHDFNLDNRTFFELYSSNDIIFSCLFSRIIRPALTELRLNFTDKADRQVLPETEDIVASCPNLKKLTLVNWPGTNAAVTKLWYGLPSLEEVSLENCKDLGNVAFIGNDVDSSAFIKLANLKKLSLKELDKMPKVTDKLFSLVIRHMPLTHLTLTSSLPLKSVTLSGVRSLLDGKFAETVEKFPFEDWSLANVSSKKLTQLKSKFRSSHML